MAIFKERIFEMWLSLNQREQASLLILGLVTILIFTFLALVQPAQKSHMRAQKALAREQEKFDRVTTMISQLKALERSGTDKAKAKGASTTPTRSVVLRAAQKSGVKVARIQTVGEKQFDVYITEIEADLLFNWLQDLRQTDGLSPKKADIKKKGEGTAFVVQLRFGG